ncbi:uncharacterized protein LACBIDRAFT_326742 [Laccaria bicolor S238N-H82]|uniref:Predicted protein n=1 Tax=Laccaria bicolor (strain S238N-H82 / ATCC MYA-4686) TaxID=486041 RepID=B0D9I9_LACBS|nr:uncharacterized protein LACBIDRAFT_326742 [Laccaria bicolor S238N-H82]EDR08360.1 predicted protein [Laccaria bicolor S238N-H82]|eukprot:XP_001880585.1 predicted protein [Laccaria bicolor S238N-H82]
MGFPATMLREITPDGPPITEQHKISSQWFKNAFWVQIGVSYNLSQVKYFFSQPAAQVMVLWKIPFQSPETIDFDDRTLLFFPALFWDGGRSSFYTRLPTHLEKAQAFILLTIYPVVLAIWPSEFYSHAAAPCKFQDKSLAYRLPLLVYLSTNDLLPRRTKDEQPLLSTNGLLLPSMNSLPPPSMNGLPRQRIEPSLDDQLPQELSISLAILTKTLAGTMGSLLSIHQKQNKLQLKELERSSEALRVPNVPRSKFVFKRRPAAAATNFRRPPSETSSTQTLPPPLQTQNAPPPPPPPAASTHLPLPPHSHYHFTREDLQSHLAPSDLSISDLR